MAEGGWKTVPLNKNKRHKNKFKIGNVNDYKWPLTNFYETPIQIGDFSTDDKNEFFDDSHQMKFLSIPNGMSMQVKTAAGHGRMSMNAHLDLKEGFENYVGSYIDKETSFDKLLRWTCSHKGEVEHRIHQPNSSKGGSSGNTSKGASSKIDFICTRKVLQSILSTIYKKDSEASKGISSDWLIYATKFRNVIYLKKIETDQAKKIQKATDDVEKKIIYYGHKFEQNLTSDSPGSKPVTSRPVNVNEEYYAVMEARLQEHGLIFSSEMDAVDPKYDNKSVKRFVEMKTNYILNSRRREKNFRSKLLPWYLQCFITGVPRLICGFRNNEGIVEEVVEYDVSDLPDIAKCVWSPNVCFNFGARFLSYIKQCVIEDNPKIVYKFSWKHGDDTICHNREGVENFFLPDWYINSMSPSTE